MSRLYLRIYLAVLASLAVFALGAGVLWRAAQEGGPERNLEMAVQLLENTLPPAGDPDAQARLERLTANLGMDAALYAADGRKLAEVGNAPSPGDGWRRGAWTARLKDGRSLVVRPPHQHRYAPWTWLALLALLALAVGLASYPVVRRLTRRLEQLQRGVESLGEGNLSARVPARGRDEIARLAGSFNRAAERIESLVQSHKALLANTSHELRTPLARIRMGIELMKQGGGSDRSSELERDIGELDTLIDEILTASRLDATQRLELEDIDLLALAAEECARYPEAELDGQPAAVRGDPRLLRRSIRNLLENARRHGAPPIELRLQRSGSDGALIEVRDHGTPIPEADRARLFEPFFRRAGTPEATGSGLGLALVRQIARRHGGDALYRIDDGRGCFVIEIAGNVPGWPAKRRARRAWDLLRNRL